MSATSTPERGAGRLAVTGGAVLIAAALTNALAYLVPVLGARHLSADDLGALATVQALIAITGVAGAGLQIAVAVNRARHPHAPTTRATVATTALTGVVLVAAGPLIVPTLDLSAEVVALFAAMTLAFVLAAGWLGELQGDQRFVRLAAGMAILALGRYAGVIGGLVLGAGLTGSLLAGLVTSYAALPILLWIARAGADRRRRPHVPRESELGLRSVLTAGVATLAMLVVSYADLILARLLLSAEDSGAYSVGTVLTKGAIWAPQIVTVLALPRMARRDRNTLTVTLAVVGASGLVLVAASAVAGELAFRLAGGPAYASLGGYAPFFAATGALYAVLFVLVNAQIATGARWPSAPLWAAMAGLVVVAVFLAPRTVPGIMWTALATATAATLAMAALALVRPGSRPDRDPRRAAEEPADERRGAREIAV